MKRMSVAVAVLGILALAGTAAAAERTRPADPAPVVLDDSQRDQVSAGQVSLRPGLAGLLLPAVQAARQQAAETQGTIFLLIRGLGVGGPAPS